MATTKVFTGTEALAALQTNPNNVLLIEKKKDQKAYSGTVFLNAYWNIAGLNRAEGLFTITDTPIKRGMADPANKSDKRNSLSGLRSRIEVAVSQAGDFGKFLIGLNPIYLAQIKQLIENNQIIFDNHKLHDLVKLKLSNKNVDNPGGELTDPIINLKIDFRLYSDRHWIASLRGKPQTEILDWRTGHTDELGRIVFDPMMVDNEDGTKSAVTMDNIHKVINDGAIIRRGRVKIGSVAVSGNYISMPITAVKLVIEPGTGEVRYSDDTDIDLADLNAKLIRPTSPRTDTVAPQSPTTDAITAAQTEDNIQAVMAQLEKVMPAQEE